MSIPETYQPSHIANYFLWRAEEEKVRDMTPMKLIKLVYIAYGWALTVFGRQLFTEKIEAWKYGPVIPSLYHEFKGFRHENITDYSMDFDLGSEEETYPMVRKDDGELVEMLHAVWNIYKKKSGKELSDITHRPGSPWSKAYAKPGQNSELDPYDIRETVSQHLQKLSKNE